MEKWKDVTGSFSEKERHYKNTYLEICEVYGDHIEVSLFSSQEEPYEIYFSYDIMYGIIYAEPENAAGKREEVKDELAQEYELHKEPRSEFIDHFAKKHKVCLPSDVLFS